MKAARGSLHFSNSPSPESITRAYQVIANSLSRQAGCAISVTFSIGKNEMKFKANCQKGA